MTELNHLVVVGVDGSESNLGAVLFAVEEARRARVPLRLVHVVPDRGVISALGPLVPLDLTDTGESVLRHAEREVRLAAPELDVEIRLRHGSRAVQLLQGADGAGVVVVGRDVRVGLDRVLHGDTATALAARAGVPVVEVPSDWRADPHSHPTYGVVVVGLKSAAYADAVLGDAFTAARSLGAELVVLHAWKLPSGYDDLAGADPAVAAWEGAALDEVETLVRRWRTAFPDVPVRTELVHEHPAHALVEASARADLVVVMRHAHGAPALDHLGSVARALLRTAACPVRVVPPTETGTIPDLVLEEAGGLLA